MAIGIVPDLPDEPLPMIEAYEAEEGSASDPISLLLTQIKQNPLPNPA